MTTRLEYLESLAPRITDELVITSIGGVMREWFHVKERDGNLYGVWMAGATGFALGLALALPHRRVISLDADGSMLMDLTILPAIAHKNPSNLIVIVFDNEVYECLPPGTCPTFTAGVADLVKAAQGLGIRNCRLVRDAAEFDKAIAEAYEAKGATFIVAKSEHIKVPLPYDTMSCTENKFRFIRYIEKTEKAKVLRGLDIPEPYTKSSGD